MIDESLIHAYRLAKYIVTYEDEEYQLQVGSTSEFVDHTIKGVRVILNELFSYLLIKKRLV
jgi:hypothetical protein